MEKAIIASLPNVTFPTTLAAFSAERDDADLLVRLRRRDASAVGLLFDRYGKPALSLALGILGEASGAEDAVSQAVVKLWNRVGTFRETRGSALGLWLMMLTYAAALQMRRGDVRPVGATLEQPALYQDWSKSFDTDKIQSAFENLELLNGSEGQVLMAAFLEGLTPLELATRYGQAQSEVDAVIASALQKLNLPRDE